MGEEELVEYLQEVYRISYITSLVVGIIALIICGIVAHKKNRSVFGWMCIGFFLGVPGIIIISCLKKKDDGMGEDQNIINNRNTWICPGCGHENSNNDDYCTSCLIEKPKKE